jgi:hypothetical protein
VPTILNADDQGTFRSIRELKLVVQEAKRPLVVWVGAGTSKWLGYPLWGEVASDLRREFFKFVAGFDNAEALELIEKRSFPRLFQWCRDLDRARYNRFLSNAFLPRPETPLYRRFTDALGGIKPMRVLTTNVDEALEQRFAGAAVFQRSNISGCVDQLQAGNSFIVKLHGSRSSIESAIFTDEDYQELRADAPYINTLRTIFALGTVVFLGYSVTDQYVIDLLSDNARDMSLFGAGPHFLVSSDFKGTANFRTINYSLKRFADHRAALTVLDLIRQVDARKTELSMRAEASDSHPISGPIPSGPKSGYFISDFMPPGTWSNSVAAQFAPKDGVTAEMTVGLGFTNDEVPFRESTAPHDLVVGLTCFDVVYFPLSALQRIVALLGDFLWQLVQADVIRFIHLRHEPAVVFVDGALIGDIGLVSIANTPAGGAETVGTNIRRQIKPVPGKESKAEELFSDLETRVILFNDADRIEMAGLVRASFMMPEVARLLGIGEAILPSQTPAWLKFPCLRMAHLVHTGVVCDRLGIQAAKIPFGGAKLTSAAFGVQAGSEFADQYASYVLSGRFNADLGTALAARPDILQNILRFRNTSEGEAFRKEVCQQLLANEAKEFSASVDAGLVRNIPIKILEKARDRLSSLFTEKVAISPVPAVWTNAFQSDDSTRLWRARSRTLLLDLVEKRGISGDDPCICGSGDKLRLCCLLPLRS